MPASAIYRASPGKIPASHRTIATLEDPCLRLLLCGYGQLLPKQWTFSRLCEPFWRLYWNSSPGATIRCGNLTVDLDPSSVVLVSPNAACTTTNTGTMDHLYLHFHSVAFHHQTASEIAVLPMAQPLLGIGEKLVELMKMQTLCTWQISLTARSFIGMVLAQTHPDMRRSPQLDARVLKVLSYIDEHLQPNTTNAELARLARMNVSSLNQLFKEQIGHTLQVHIRIKRIEKASLMLQFSDASIEQIAEATGFCDRYHFTRVFRSVQKMTPAAYRLSNTPATTDLAGSSTVLHAPVISIPSGTPPEKRGGAK